MKRTRKKAILFYIVLISVVVISVILYLRERTITVYMENESIEIRAKEKDEYILNGWFPKEVIRIYSKDGEERLIMLNEMEKYDLSDWGKEPFMTIYSKDGEEKIVPVSEAEALIGEGWVTYPPSWEGLDDLKKDINSFIATQRGSWGVFVQNLENSEYLLINEGRYSSASLVKVYTMAAVFSQMEKGGLEDSVDIRNKLKLMITESSNEACNYLTIKVGEGNEALGFDRENEIALSLGCENTERGSYLVEMSGRKGPYRHHNYTSPRDCGRILNAIYHKELVSEEASDDMLKLLLGQTRTWKIPEALPKGTVVANKTGETDTANSDIAIVYSPKADYIICVLGNGDVKYGVGTINKISRMVYDYFN